jgi:hypothetical protein
VIFPFTGLRAENLFAWFHKHPARSSSFRELSEQAEFAGEDARATLLPNPLDMGQSVNALACFGLDLRAGAAHSLTAAMRSPGRAQSSATEEWAFAVIPVDRAGTKSRPQRVSAVQISESASRVQTRSTFSEDHSLFVIDDDKHIPCLSLLKYSAHFRKA